MSNNTVGAIIAIGFIIICVLATIMIFVHYGLMIIDDFEGIKLKRIRAGEYEEGHDRRVRNKAIDDFFLMVYEAYISDNLDECELNNIERKLKEQTK